jgi:hypothetical protein
MRKWLLICATATAFTTLQAQNNEVVTAELSFAKYAQDYSVRKAFLRYLDSNGVVFNQGEMLNGLKTWEGSPESPGKLLWHPAYAAMAASGDLGFTTGPYEVRRSMNDTAISAGQYTTVWVRNKAGEWKFLADMGISYKQSLYNKQPLKQALSFTKAPDKDTDIMPTEHQFIANYKTKGLSAFHEVAMDGSWFNINREQPKTALRDIESGLGKVPADLEFIPVAGGMAASRDLAYVYGTVQYKQKKENYLRIWAYTPAGWKVLVQVLKW